MRVNEKEYLAKLSYDTFLKEYPFFDFNNLDNFNYWIEKLVQSEELMLNKNRFFLLLDHTNFRPIYLSKNYYKIFDDGRDKKLNKVPRFDFHRFHWKQLGAMLNFLRWGAKFANDYRDKVPVFNHNRYFCGLKLRQASGSYRTTFVKLKFLLVNENDKPILSLSEIDDITHLYKSHLYWMRISAENSSHRLTRFHVSKGPKKIYEDILSKRELEVLKLCAQQKDNKEIGQLLGISFQTVLKHRKNMISRTGVKDMAGLLHICKLCDLI